MRPGLLNIGEKIALTLWVGGMWTVGYVVAPILFIHLEDRALAATLAGQMFKALGVIGMICGIILLAGQLLQFRMACIRQWRSILVFLMLLLTVLGLFVIHPMIVELRGIPEQQSTLTFLHRMAEVAFLLTSLMGLVLVIFGLRPSKDIPV